MLDTQADVDEWRWLATGAGIVFWAGFGLPSLITPFLAPSPWELPLVGVTITAFVAGLIAGAWHTTWKARSRGG